MATRTTYPRNRMPASVRESMTTETYTAGLSPEDEAWIVRASASIIWRSLQRGEVLTDPARCAEFFTRYLRGMEHESFCVLFLDTRHRAIACEEMFRGTIDGAEVYPREVVKRSLQHNAAAVIICHNHPSGSTEPSAADRAVTTRLRDALAMVEIRLLDHFVVGDGSNPTSLAARGWV